MHHAFRRVLILGLAILMAIVIILPESITAQPPTPSIGELKARWWADGFPTVLTSSPSDSLATYNWEMPEGSSSLSPPEHGATPTLDWSRIVFQSYRDGNWEIYLSHADGSQPLRLTHHPATDAYPRLNRGATRIVFSSNRDDNFEIYTMNVDGSDLRRLTFNSASDISPAWSPDAKRIAFATNRHGNWEIYIMNADGSAQTRLTYNPGDEIMPTWSPDGSEITYVGNYRSPDYISGFILAINADGSNWHFVTSQDVFLNNPQNPIWSPAGTPLAFDYSPGADFTNKLVLYFPNEYKYKAVYNASQALTDVWMGSWSPDGAWLLFSRLNLVIRDNGLLLRNAFIEKISQEGGPVERILASGYDMLPDWQSMDISPPQSQVGTLPPYERATGFLVQWSGKDDGLSGLAGYDVQYRLGSSGVWVDWQTGTTATSATFSETPAATVYFRSRAQDNAGNLEDWPPGDGDTSTTLYSWRLNGAVTDTRGVPVRDAGVEVNPPALNWPSAGSDGRFQLYMPSAISSAVRVSKENFGSVPAAVLSGQTDATQWWALPPQDERLVNGEFEQADLAPWQVSGLSPVILDRSMAHTGNASLRLGQSGVQEATNISSNPGNSGLFGPPRVATDTAGNLHVVWSDMTPGSPDIFYTMRSADGVWTTPAPIAPHYAGASYHPSLGVSLDGTVHVAWMDWSPEMANVSYSFKPPAGTWAVVQDISGPIRTSPLYPTPPVLAVDGDGNLHVAWSDSSATGIWYARKGKAESWSSPSLIILAGNEPTLSAGPDRLVHLVWRDRASGHLLYTSRSWGSPWAEPAQVTNSDLAMYALRLAVGPQGNVYLIWIEVSSRSNVIYFSERTAGGAWSTPIPLSGRDKPDLSYVSLSDYLAAGSDGRVHVAWASRDGSGSEIRYRVRSPEGEWSDVFPVTQSKWEANGPSLLAGNNGLAHVVWFEGPPSSNTEVFYAQVNLAQPIAATVAQAVSLPAHLHRPTLSFAYRLESSNPADSLTAAVNGTSIFSTSTPVRDWTHAWTDLSMWAGKTVTLTFTLNGRAPEIAYLDSVSVGPWLTPLVSGVSPQNIPAGTTTAITITGQNFVATPRVRLNQRLLSDVRWVDAQTLHVTVPSDMPPDVYDVWVKNPDGPEGLFPRGLVIGQKVYLPAVLKNVAP